jgi:hypothetical protein
MTNDFWVCSEEKDSRGFPMKDLSRTVYSERGVAERGAIAMREAIAEREERSLQ